MTVSNFLHFVCDRCGNRWAAMRSKQCPGCRHTALWQFDNENKAREHAAYIMDPSRTVAPLTPKETNEHGR